MAVKIHRKEAVRMDQLVEEFIKSMRIAAGLNTQRVFAAWDACSGAGPYTLKRFYRGGKLYITLNSSVVQSQLAARKDFLVEMINAKLGRDDLFEQDDKNANWVEELILK